MRIELLCRTALYSCPGKRIRHPRHVCSGILFFTFLELLLYPVTERTNHLRNFTRKLREKRTKTTSNCLLSGRSRNNAPHRHTQSTTTFYRLRQTYPLREPRGNRLLLHHRDNLGGDKRILPLAIPGIQVGRSPVRCNSEVFAGLKSDRASTCKPPHCL